MARPPRRRSYRAYAYDRRLSPQYKDRLHGEGVGREEYVAGYSVKKKPPLTSARVDAAVGRLSRDQERPEDLGLLRRWYRSKPSRGGAPTWVKGQPGLNKVATAAALSQIYSPPSTWDHVTFTPSTDPTWDMTVTFEDGSQRTIEVPGYTVEDIRAWLAQNDIANDIGGTP